MEKEFIPYNLALELKELGFDEPCLGYYIELRNPQEGILTIDKCENNIDGVLALLYQQAFRWFRENYDFYNQVHKGYGWEGIIRNSANGNIEWNDGTYNSYEEAELACLKKLIEIAQNK